MKYRSNVYTAVKNYFIDNYHQQISEKEIDKLPKYEVLDYFLKWEGIYGYTVEIMMIIEDN